MGRDGWEHSVMWPQVPTAATCQPPSLGAPAQLGEVRCLPSMGMACFLSLVGHIP